MKFRCHCSVSWNLVGCCMSALKLKLHPKKREAFWVGEFRIYRVHMQTVFAMAIWRYIIGGHSWIQIVLAFRVSSVSFSKGLTFKGTLELLLSVYEAYACPLKQFGDST